MNPFGKAGLVGGAVSAAALGALAGSPSGTVRSPAAVAGEIGTPRRTSG
ncbi:hypothetical protein BTZ20_1609 [Rhodococcus sp. MTM3W5.2]|nr:hypothetical protein [Rhodococcus sp. MTM3W5.2]AQA23289.1 hypothetical protein BTZ20_1609 [Rhodococcus sp. MTM3W5.2]